MTRLVILASGAGSLTRAVLAAVADETVRARVVGIVSDRFDAGVLDVAGVSAVPAAVVSPWAHADRPDWDLAMADTLRCLSPDWVVSLGFMRILGPATLDAFPDRILNTHPALLPAFPGVHAVRDALARGVAVTGCSVHLVDAGVDTGPVIRQAVVEVLDDDDEASLHERIKVVERRVVVEVLAELTRVGLVVHADQLPGVTTTSRSAG